jgi:hypothetical protein
MRPEPPPEPQQTRWFFWLHWRERAKSKAEPDTVVTVEYADAIGPYAARHEAERAREQYQQLGWVGPSHIDAEVSDLIRLGAPERPQPYRAAS